MYDTSFSKTKFPVTKALLSVHQTKRFLHELDLACRILDSDFLENTMKRLNLLDRKDAIDFLEESKERLDFWKDELPAIKIKNVTSFNSRCIACSFGKNVKVYQVEYEKNLSGIPSKVNYTNNFGINLQLKKGELIDFAWCNAYLKEEEMEELK